MLDFVEDGADGITGNACWKQIPIPLNIGAPLWALVFGCAAP
ncbi:MAG: hypothetical protein QF435_17175 [Arenicellales bacterium]|jgi:hypothetical protein|nr:hypothetical protein [Arenicellales bacterium]|tara:strand:- start:1271 stop:1396 length:126 start_codon:yes stop_codon:yes gene_type:complete